MNKNYLFVFFLWLAVWATTNICAIDYCTISKKYNEWNAVSTVDDVGTQSLYSASIKVNGVEQITQGQRTTTFNYLQDQKQITANHGDSIEVKIYLDKWPENASLSFDWNMDGVFEDVRIAWQTTYAEDGFIVDASVPAGTVFKVWKLVVPDNASVGFSRMRIISTAKVCEDNCNSYDITDPCGPINGDGVSYAGSVHDFGVNINPKPLTTPRNVSISSTPVGSGSVAFTAPAEAVGQTTISSTEPITVQATAALGKFFKEWRNVTTNEVLSTDKSFTYYGENDVVLEAVFIDGYYRDFRRAFTNNKNQENRYLTKVTTNLESTPTVFEATTEAELPYTAYTANAGTYVREGAMIDKTETPIKVAVGATSFDMTFFGYSQTLSSGYSVQLNWTQQACFIDWNNDFEFSNDEIYARTTTLPNAQFISTSGYVRNIAVPTNQPAGTYTMFVIYYEPTGTSTDWTSNLFNEANSTIDIRNGVAYKFAIQVGEPVFYNLSATPNDVAKGDVILTPEAGSLKENTSITARAVPASLQYKFVEWQKDGGVVSTANPYIFNLIEETALTAIFAENDKFVVSFNSADTEKITVSGTKNGGEALVSGTSYYSGETITLEALELNEYFKFAGWSNGTSIVSTDNPYSFTLSEGVNLTATISEKDKYSLTYSMETAEAGTITATVDGAIVNSGDLIYEGKQVVLQCVTDEANGIAFKQWGGSSTSTSNPLTITMTQNMNFIAKTQQQPMVSYEIIIYPDGYGEISAGTTPAGNIIQSGTIQFTKAKPVDGCEFSEWRFDFTDDNNVWYGADPDANPNDYEKEYPYNTFSVETLVDFGDFLADPITPDALKIKEGALADYGVTKMKAYAIFTGTPTSIESVKHNFGTVKAYISDDNLVLESVEIGAMIKVVDAFGHIISNSKATKNRESIQLSQKGVYLILITGSEKQILKVLK